jgi:hypothetical protein
MLSVNLTKALKTIYTRMHEGRIAWALVGSTNMKLQGMDAEPRDLDIVVQYRNLNDVRQAFSDYLPSKITQLKSLGGKPAWEVKTKINDIEVQFNGANEDDVYVSKLLAHKIAYVALEYTGMYIPCLTLEAEAQAYVETNRPEKAQLIQQYLKSLYPNR